MIISNDKSNMTIDRIALENRLLQEQIKLNTKELKKRIEEIKELSKIYEFELELRRPRKIISFYVETKENDLDTDIEIKNFLYESLEKKDNNKIKVYNTLYKFIYLKLKYPQIIETKEIETPTFKLIQINPKLILKKPNKYIINNNNTI